ncbi:MAG: hypothetical protein AAGF32_02305 [Pseudomonadota bacterium]
MKRFAELLERLVYTPSRNGKLRLLVDYFAATPDPARGWAVAVLTDELQLALPVRRIFTDLLAERVDPHLFRLSRDYVGDTAETVALLWPEPEDQGAPPSVTDVVEGVRAAGRHGVAVLLEAWLDTLDANGRWALLKLLTGALRVGVSARLAKTALAQYGNERRAALTVAANGDANRDGDGTGAHDGDQDTADVGTEENAQGPTADAPPPVTASVAAPVTAPVTANDIEELWHGLEPPFEELFAWLDGEGDKPDISNAPVFRPLMLANPLEDKDFETLEFAEYLAEWKWDGIRVQIVGTGLEARIYSRTGDDISAAFPDIAGRFSADAVVDGELLIVKDGEVRPFNDLQQRLNRKTVSAKMMRELPAHVRLYDLLFEDGEDLRSLGFAARRERLET